jgi:hypothetical protein
MLIAQFSIASILYSTALEERCELIDRAAEGKVVTAWREVFL